MTLSETARKDIMQSYIELITHAADREYQNRIWIRELGPDCEDYDDFIGYFLYESRAILKDYKAFGISDDQHDLLLSFTKEVEDFNRSDRSRWSQRFLRSREWKQIIKMARVILKSFNKELPFSDKDKNKVLRDLLDNILHAADEEYQQSLWIKEIGPRSNGFNEFIGQFYHAADEILENYRDFNVTDEQYRLLLKFSEQLALYEPFHPWFPAQKFLQSPEWKKIIEIAKEVLTAFHYRVDV